MKKTNRSEAYEEYSMCAYCENASAVVGGACICRFKGMVADTGICKKFALDLLKIVPHGVAVPASDDIAEMFE